MSKVVYVGLAFLSAGCMFARASHTGHLVVALTDRETGGPITNATVTVTVDRSRSLSWHASPKYEHTTANADSNGIVHVEFQRNNYASQFQWRVDAPGHFNGRFGSGYGNERFGCEVEKSDYFDINTNTVQGLAMYNELMGLYDNDYLGFLAKFNPKSVICTNNVIHRSVCLTPKHNPQPMYAHYFEDDVFLPIRNTIVATNNGIEVVQYDPVDFDMKECLVICTKPDYDYHVHGSTGKNSDFCIERSRVLTNGVKTIHGSIAFAPGCGAYVTQLPGDGHYPLIYEADTNATFLSRIPFEYSIVSGEVVQASQLLSKDECMVLKTRTVTNETGEVVSCNYSKIYGPMSVDRRMRFDSLVFNPNPNDPNLEFNGTNNLAKPYGNCWVRP